MLGDQNFGEIDDEKGMEIDMSQMKVNQELFAKFSEHMKQSGAGSELDQMMAEMMKQANNSDPSQMHQEKADDEKQPSSEDDKPTRPQH